MQTAAAFILVDPPPVTHINISLIIVSTRVHQSVFLILVDDQLA